MRGGEGDSDVVGGPFAAYPPVCVFITAVPKLFAWGSWLLFITAVPNTKLFALGEGDSGGHVLRDTMSRGLWVLVVVYYWGGGRGGWCEEWARSG